MKVSHAILGGIIAGWAACPLLAQSPALSSIEAPYPALQSPVRLAGGSYPAGVVAYGPAGTPLVLSGSNFGASGIVTFIPYQSGVAGIPVQAAATMWTPTLLILTVPSGVGSGVVTVTSQGKTSNSLPFLVTLGTYSGSCPALPPNSQLQIVTSSLNDGMVGQAYSVTLSATGGTQAYTWSISGGLLPAGLSLNTSTGVISGTPTAASGPVSLTVQVADSSSPQKTDSVALSLTIDASGQPAVIYSYCISASPSASCTSPSGGYDAVGNLVSYSDSVTGTWSMGNGYDSLNRLTAANATAGPYQGLQASWTYDDFGNRTAESMGGTLANPQQAPPIPGSGTAEYNANNQVYSASPGPVPTYDPSGAGDVTNDGQNQYLYDAEGRICAVRNLLGGMTEYLYNAEGVRVAKGTITTFSCDTTINPTTGQPNNGFQTTVSYILDQNNQQLTEMSWSSGTPQWAHTEVRAAGELIATYGADPDSSDNQPGILYFHLTDWLGTRRVLTDYAGNVEESCHSLPYGDGEDCASTHSAHLFTGKERDTESGNDYFGARYYSSAMGRWMSPDPSPAGVNVMNPQSWNLYNYALNNPLRMVDRNGYWATDVHAQIVTYSLQNYVSAGELNELRARQYSMDADQSNQNRHSMANTGQSSADALNGMWNFVRDEMNIASQNLGAGGALNSTGLDALGDAMHTLEDYTSPMHTDSNFMPMEWKGGYWPPWKMGPGAVHVMGESSPENDWSRIGLAVRLTMAAYLESGAGCEAGKSCLTAANFESEWRKNVETYVNNFYNSQMVPLSGSNAIKEDAARQCALGNPAACDH